MLNTHSFFIGYIMKLNRNKLRALILEEINHSYMLEEDVTRSLGGFKDVSREDINKLSRVLMGPGGRFVFDTREKLIKKTKKGAEVIKQLGIESLIEKFNSLDPRIKGPMIDLIEAGRKLPEGIKDTFIDSLIAMLEDLK